MFSLHLFHIFFALIF